jgi:ubiquinone/menaquinone biosynthesis C-methylase UbiE
MNDPDAVREQYATETNLETRRSVWRPGPSGIDLHDLVLDEVRAALPDRGGMPDVLEVGCGPGLFAARLVRELPGIALLATDTSPRMVELTRQHGIPAQVQDVQQLLAPDASYDVVLALAMLYHVPDLDRALGEVRRVLRPSGSFIAQTIANEHTADLRRDAGGDAASVPFSRENGEELLRRHFSTVSRHDLETRAVFPDRATALAYLESSNEEVDWNPPEEGWPREYAGHASVFVAR